tara:strand:+ start:389 stop:1012 length:624 start_codon:yes stop_codon:yes gene_type:complete
MAHSTDTQTLSAEEQEKILIGFNEVWKREKKDKKINQTEVAEAMGMKQASFSQYLSGVTPISMRFLIRVCNVLKVPPQDIYPPISELLPNRRHSTVKWKSSDTENEFNDVLIYNPSIEWTSIVVDKPITWKLVNGDIMRAPEGATLACLDINEDGQWSWNKKLKADNFVVHLKGSTEWNVVNRLHYERLLEDDQIRKAFILMGVRLL